MKSSINSIFYITTFSKNFFLLMLMTAGKTGHYVQNNHYFQFFSCMFLFYVNFTHSMKSVLYGVFFWSVFSVFWLNTDIYIVNIRIQSEYGKMRTTKNSIFGHFLHSVTLQDCILTYLYSHQVLGRNVLGETSFRQLKLGFLQPILYSKSFFSIYS